MLFRMMKELVSTTRKPAAVASDDQALDAHLTVLADSIEPIQGWLDKEAGKVLYRLARFHVPTPNIVELGSWKGRSTAWLANGIRDRGEGRVYAVDTWQGTQNEEAHGQLLAGYSEGQLQREFLGNLESRGLLGFVEPIRSDTITAVRHWNPDRKIGLLFIDADHSYEAVRRDFEYWSPHVEVGGYIVFDDVMVWWGPSRLITELPRWYSPVGVSPSNWIVVKNGG
jgi:predicted O-methyltransferase YrrM